MILLVIVFLILIIALHRHTKDYEVIMASYNRSNETMTVVFNNGETCQYVGSGTVWYRLLNMKRCATSDEVWLVEIYKYIIYFKCDYPMADKQRFGI